VLAAGIALIVVGVVLGLFFPVVFVAAAAGLVLLILSFVATARRAKTASADTEDPTPDRPE
jgi:membrane protein implicated in regulation of membrane protease activity